VGTKIVDTALANGLLINSPRPNTLRFMPALNVTQPEIDEMIRILRQSLVATLDAAALK
jgi:acetylornithine/N-succinyldiaminopimelate aminotransferase